VADAERGEMGLTSVVGARGADRAVGVVVAGRRACGGRGAGEGIRAKLPAGTATAFMPAELAFLDGRRTSHQHFSPYAP
jgi:hypothetical protein